MDLERGMRRSGFDSWISLITGTRLFLGGPGQGKLYGRLYGAYVIFIDVCIVLNCCTYFWKFVSPGASFDERIFTGCPVAYLFLITLRRLDMHFRRSRYLKLMEEYQSLYNEHSELNRDVVRFAIVVRNVFRTLIYSTAISLLGIGVVPIFVFYMGGPMELTVPSSYPFDPTENIFIFSVICLGMGWAGFHLTSREILYQSTFTIFACRQLALSRHLTRELERILGMVRVGEGGEVAYHCQGAAQLPKEQARAIFLSELKEWVINHQKSLRMAGELQNLYTFTIFTQFTINGFVLCGCTYVVGNFYGGTKSVSGCASYMLTVLIELFITCRIGSLILEESNSMERVLEGTHVYAMSNDVYGKWLRMILTRVKVPIKLKALGVYPLDIETYKSIVGTTYSIYTLLMSMKD